jgi:hypothetical protein
MPMKFPLTLLLLLLFAGELQAQVKQKSMTPAPRDVEQGKKSKVKERTPPPEAEAIIADARIAPPEFAADALIRVAQSSKVADAELKRELLEEAFRLAAGAQQPFKLYTVVGNVDTRAGYLSYALQQGFDTLSLRCRVVRAMLQLDKRRARELLGEISPDLALETLGCEDALVYDVSELYETAGEVARVAFTIEERRGREHIRLVEPFLVGVRSATQVGPAAKLIVSLKAAPSDLMLIVQEFAGALKSVPADTRSFAASFFRDDLIRQMNDLAKECDTKGVGKDALLEAYRAFLVEHFGGVQCADNRQGLRKTTNPKFLPGINAPFTKNPISAEEVQPRRVEGAAHTYEYWKTGASRKFLLEIKRLRFGDKQEQLTAEEKETTEWRGELADFLRELSDWDGSSEESRTDYINQKSVLFMGLLELDLPREMRDTVLDNFVAFLREPDLQRESRIEWFWHVRWLLNWSRSDGKDARKNLLGAFGNSDVVVLRLYAALDGFDLVKEK